jgi:hypothetical protein
MRIRMGLALGLLLVLGVAGCGGSDGDDGIASAGGTPSASASAGGAGGPDTAAEDGLKFARCMRENGIPNFPDPKPNDGGGFDISLPDGVDKAKVDAAQERCKQYMPNGGEPQKMPQERLEQLRKYSKCMRDNGVTDFPDPTDQGLQIDGNKVNPNDPKVKAARNACDKYQPAPPKGESAGPGLQNGGGE